MATICDIPFDIVHQYIIPGFLFGDVKKIYHAGIFTTTISEMISSIIKNDSVLQNHSEKFKVDIYDTVEKSSITFSDFDQIISDIRNNTLQNSIITFNMKKLNRFKISNTILIMNLFKEYALKNKNIECHITNNLVRYMSLVFNKKNKERIRMKVFSGEFSLSLQQCSWSKLDICIYDLFEKFNLTKFKHHSCKLKANIGKHLITDEVNDVSLYNTIRLFVQLADNSHELMTKSYIIYELYRYLNYTRENHVYFQNISQNQERYREFYDTSIAKAEEFMNDIQNAPKLPRYLYDLLKIELTKHSN